MDEPDFTFVLSGKQPEQYIPSGCIEYDCNNSKRGIGLIFNQRSIPGEHVREGSEIDRDRLEMDLKMFGFDVRTFDELNYADIIEVLKSVAKEDHSDNDCLWICYMAHGSKGMISAHDQSFSVNELWEPFLGANCPSLINKPKLFFIEACRGADKDLGVQYLRKTSAALTDSSSTSETVSIPITADLLVFYSGYEDYVSYLDTRRGSRFMESLCEELEKIKENTELYQLFTAVNRKVAYQYTGYFQSTKQMPTILSTLTKLFYLQKTKLIEN